MLEAYKHTYYKYNAFTDYHHSLFSSVFSSKMSGLFTAVEATSVAEPKSGYCLGSLFRSFVSSASCDESDCQNDWDCPGTEKCCGKYIDLVH